MQHHPAARAMSNDYAEAQHCVQKALDWSYSATNTASQLPENIRLAAKKIQDSLKDIDTSLTAAMVYLDTVIKPGT